MIDGLPRAGLAHLPTPLESCDRLTAELGGPRILVKRDDCTGLAIGGNKTRKLEFLLGRALAEGHDTVVTFGALQSNHARQTAAACARMGLRCELVLSRSVPRDDMAYETSGNILLDHLLGANVHVTHGLDETVKVLEEIGPAYVIPPGGSDATGMLGYVAAAYELAAQCHEVDRIVVGTATAGTTAGLLLGLPLAGLAGTRVEGICVYELADTTGETLAKLIAEGAELPGAAGAAPYALHDDWLGPGYGMPTPEMLEAVRLFARTEGLLLDPVYTGKAAAGLLGLIRTGRIGPDETVVFWHTGGTPGLFAYAEEFG